MPKVFNISNITSTRPMSVNIGLVKIRPGKFKDIPAESINSKTIALHGKVIWIGDNLPLALLKKQNEVHKPKALSREEVSAYLHSLSLDELKSLLSYVTPSTPVKASAPHRRYVYTLTALCFSPEHDLDPEKFFWLKRWNRLSNGDYQEV